MISSRAADEARRAFAALLKQARRDKGLARNQLARNMGYDASYVSHVERLRHPPTADFARRADVALDADGGLWRYYREFQLARGGRDPGELALVADERGTPSVGMLHVESETARLRYIDGRYHCQITRRLRNVGTEPVIYFRVNISVDRYPGNSEWSNRLYRADPLTSEELDFEAHVGDPSGAKMDWRVSEDWDSRKEIVLSFANDREKFPLYPGKVMTISYSYAVSETKWGPWFERAITIPTDELSVRLEFPRSMDPTVWGERGTHAGDRLLPTPVRESVEGDNKVYDWSTKSPLLTSSFRLQWRFRAAPDEPHIEHRGQGGLGFDPRRGRVDLRPGRATAVRRRKWTKRPAEGTYRPS